jgi:hypothetical protein
MKRAEKEKEKKKKGMWVVDARKWARAPVTPLLLQPRRVRAVLLRARQNEHKRRRGTALDERESGVEKRPFYLGRGERPRDEA